MCKRLQLPNVHLISLSPFPKAVVQACSFHPSAPALLVGGLDKTLKIFHVRLKSRSCLSTLLCCCLSERLEGKKGCFHLWALLNNEKIIDKATHGFYVCLDCVDCVEAMRHSNMHSFTPHGLTFQVDGKDNSMLQSVFMRDMPIYAAQWSHFGEEVGVQIGGFFEFLLL